MRITCPGCRNPMTRPGLVACPVCELVLTGPDAQELWWVDDQLARLTRRRRDLIARLYGPVPVTWPVMVGPQPALVDVSRVGVRNVLLVLGGLLLGIAAVAFTVISWGSLSLGARALILVSLTGVTLGVVWPLARRGLSATAETLAVIGLLLVGLECYAAYAGGLFGLQDVDGRWYAAWAAAAVTVGWSVYAWVAPLRAPRPLAIVIGQLPLPLGAFALDVPVSGMVFTLLLLSLLDLGVWSMVATARERGVAAALGALSWSAGGFTALLMAHTTSSEQSAALLVFAAGVALSWAVFVERKFAIATGLTLSVGATAALPLTERWEPAAAAAIALVVMAGALLLPVRLRRMAAIGGLLTLGIATLIVLPSAVFTLVSPLRHLDDVWTGTMIALPSDQHDSAPIVLALLAVALCVLVRVAAPPVAALAVLVIPDLAYPVLPALMVALAALLAGWAALDRQVHVSAGLTAVSAGLWAVAEALATEAATLGVLGALTVGGIVCAVVPVLRSGAAATASLALGGFAATLGLTVDLPVHQAAFGVLAAAALGLAASAWLRDVPTEVAACMVGMAGVVMTATHPTYLSLALSLGGVLAFAVALRADRRPAAGWVCSVLMVAAWWVRLGASDIAAPEAYTLPISVALLVLGFLRRRSVESPPSSWAAYGPGLAATLVPSLMAAWAGEPGEPRALILAAAALAITLVGARTRLQALLILGGTVLAFDAGRQLAPYAVEALVRLPGWFPVAVIGLLVLVVGATYEHRLRDLRRLRDAVTRLG
ncbi:SCO7613 C-terminal domain-containing membrane protein [Actinomadura sp. 6N118]|uniref:SCO7613 C-terminal domain-containing membrane protein n=1 Tax=Actinomadura sp. 6N118 TaxID=3375151 RepID=UPI0037A16A06